MKNSNILKLMIFIFISQFSTAQKLESSSSKMSTKTIEISEKLFDDVPIAKNVKGNISLNIKKEILQKAVQKSLEELKQPFKVSDVKIVMSNIKTYYLAIVGNDDESKQTTTLFLPLGNTGNSPNYYFFPTPGGHVPTCINITGCPNNCTIIKLGEQHQFTACNCGGFDPGSSPANGNTPTVSCNFKFNKLLSERALSQAIKIKLAAFY